MTDEFNNTRGVNLGTSRIPPLRMANFPDADAIVAAGSNSKRGPDAVDIMLVNPPTPDGSVR